MNESPEGGQAPLFGLSAVHRAISRVLNTVDQNSARHHPHAMFFLMLLVLVVLWKLTTLSEIFAWVATIFAFGTLHWLIDS